MTLYNIFTMVKRTSSKSRKHMRGGDCGCASNRVVLQTGGRIVNASEYYGHDSGRYSADNIGAPLASAQAAERAAAFNTIAGSTTMAGGRRRRSGKKKQQKKK